MLSESPEDLKIVNFKSSESSENIILNNLFFRNFPIINQYRLYYCWKSPIINKTYLFIFRKLPNI